jgi:hypothetical protein
VAKGVVANVRLTAPLTKSTSHRERPLSHVFHPAMVSPRPQEINYASASLDDHSMRRAATVGSTAEALARDTVPPRFVGSPEVQDRDLPYSPGDDDHIEPSAPPIPPAPATPVSVSAETIQAVGSSNVQVGLFGDDSKFSEAEADAKMNEYIVQHGIRRIVVGHQPRGDAPLVLSRGNLEVNTLHPCKYVV